MTASYQISDTVVNSSGVPISGVTVNAWKATRLGSPPALGAAPPSGSPDATATSGPASGGTGAFVLGLPTNEPYWVQAVIDGVNVWKYYAAPVVPVGIGEDQGYPPAIPTAVNFNGDTQNLFLMRNAGASSPFTCIAIGPGSGPLAGLALVYLGLIDGSNNALGGVLFISETSGSNNEFGFTSVAGDGTIELSGAGLITSASSGVLDMGNYITSDPATSETVKISTTLQASDLIITADGIQGLPSGPSAGFSASVSDPPDPAYQGAFVGLYVITPVALYVCTDATNPSAIVWDQVSVHGAQTTLTGSTSGQAVANQPVAEQTYKKVLISLQAMHDAGQSYTFPVPFLESPAVVKDATSGVTVSTTQVTLPSTSGVTGWVIIEGY